MIDLYPSTPDYKAPDMDKQGQGLLDQTLQTGTSNVQSAYDRGSEAAMGMMPTRDNAFRDDVALARDTKAQTEAILRKGETLFSKNMKKLMMNHKLEAERAKADRLSQNFSLSSRQRQLFQAIQDAKLQAEANKIAARNQVIRSLLSLGGTAVGFMAGGAGGGLVANQVMQNAGPQDGGMKGLGSTGLSQGGTHYPAHTRNADGNGLGDFEDRMRAGSKYGDF